jgi:hypothetical protein
MRCGTIWTDVNFRFWEKRGYLVEEKNEEELQGELDFLAAMNAYRRAKESGDADRIREAEEAWRAQVRDELAKK